MTQKEKLYFEYLRLKNELEKLQGKEVEELTDTMIEN
jgi:predicted nucleotidyltransferase